MSRQYWSELIWWSTADATPFANTTTEGLLVPDINIPANYMADGRVLRVTLAGKISNTASATMIWATRWGGVAATLLAQSEALSIGTAVTNIMWRLVMEIQTRVNGASGALLAIAQLQISLTAGTALDHTYSVSGFDAPAQVTVDLSVDKLFSMTGDWSAANAANTMTSMLYLGESLN